jgi:hypothetical protein
MAIPPINILSQLECSFARSLRVRPRDTERQVSERSSVSGPKIGTAFATLMSRWVIEEGRRKLGKKKKGDPHFTH